MEIWWNYEYGVNYPFNNISKNLVSWLLVLICPEQHRVGLWIMSINTSHLLADSLPLTAAQQAVINFSPQRRHEGRGEKHKTSSLTFLHSSASLNISRSSSGLSPELSSSSPTPSSRISSAGRQHGRLHLGSQGAKYQEAWRISLLSPLIKIQVRPCLTDPGAAERLLPSRLWWWFLLINLLK